MNEEDKKSERMDFIGKNIRNMVVMDGIIADVMVGRTSIHSKTAPAKSRTSCSNADNTTFFCVDCKKVWEFRLDMRPDNDKITIFHSHVPSYGKRRKKCANCLGKYGLGNKGS